MSSLSRKLALGFVALAGHLSLGAAADTPYLETIPATILWQFNVTGVGKNRVAQPAESSAPIENPDVINPVDRITTETGTPVTFSGGNGTQAFFVQQLLRRILENYAEDTLEHLVPAAEKSTQAEEATAAAATAFANADAATIAGNTDAAAQYTALGNSLTEQAVTLTAEAAALVAQAEVIEDNIKLLKRQLNDQWEFTFVRSPQTSAEGVMTSPYWLFLTKADSLQDRLIRGYDTGLRLVPKYSAGARSETMSGESLTKVTGTITTYFTLEFSNLFSTDPLHEVALESRGVAIEGETYNTAGKQWEAFGSGYLTYGLRKVMGTSNGVAPTRMKATGFGTWSNLNFDLSANTYSLFVGTAPLGIKLGEVKYQRSEFFPEYTPPSAP